jgi:hypothetical protein
LLHLARYQIRGLAATAGDRPRDRFRMSEQNYLRLQAVADADRQWFVAS